MHTNEKTMECTICNKRFTSQHSLGSSFSFIFCLSCEKIATFPKKKHKRHGIDQNLPQNNRFFYKWFKKTQDNWLSVFIDSHQHQHAQDTTANSTVAKDTQKQSLKEL